MYLIYFIHFFWSAWGTHYIKSVSLAIAAADVKAETGANEYIIIRAKCEAATVQLATKVFHITLLRNTKCFFIILGYK